MSETTAMVFWNWFKRKPLDFEEVFGALSGKKAQQFYGTHFPDKNSYNSFGIKLPEPLLLDVEPLFDPVESFQFFGRPFKVGKRWILAYHMEYDTPTIIVNQDFQVLLEGLGVDDSTEEYFVVDHFLSFLDLLTLEADAEEA
ncbi:hypothetical protein [Gimesia maris]|uniref:hypothetical protein n=1 Tax=Gimesia maris TaxID=122 RepID=UPI003A8D4DF3